MKAANERPKLKLELTRFDRILEYAGWLGLLIVWLYTLINYAELPGTIPVHFNITGEADRFGDKINILILPVVATVIFIALTYLNKFPHKLNYPVRITQENALTQYTFATRLVRTVKTLIVLIFGLIIYRTIQTAHGIAEGFGVWFLIAVLAPFFLLLPYFLYKALKNK